MTTTDTDSDKDPSRNRQGAPEPRGGRNAHLAFGHDPPTERSAQDVPDVDANLAIVQEFTGHLALMVFNGILLEDPAGIFERQGPDSDAARRHRRVASSLMEP